jgi:hypothetical protein
MHRQPFDSSPPCHNAGWNGLWLPIYPAPAVSNQLPLRLDSGGAHKHALVHVVWQLAYAGYALCSIMIQGQQPIQCMPRIRMIRAASYAGYYTTSV